MGDRQRWGGRGGEAGEGGKTGGKTRLFRGRLGPIALWLDAASHFFFY